MISINVKWGGSRPFKFENTILTYGLGVMAWTVNMYQQLECGFGSMHTILPIWGLGAKIGSKTEILKESARA